MDSQFTNMVHHLIILVMIVVYSSIIIKKIEKINDKIDNIHMCQPPADKAEAEPTQP
jgi:hypothetical protein